MVRSVRSTALVPLLAAVAVLAAACGSDGDAGNAGPSVTQVGQGTTTADGSSTGATAASPAKVTATVVGTAASPTVLLARPGDDGHLWIAERAGRVLRATVNDDGTLDIPAEPALDLSDQTTTELERGLLGLAFSPDGATLYASYTDPDGNTRVVSYALDGDRVDASSRTVLLRQDQPYGNHNGGNIVIGPDGKLWLGLGDGGAADDPENRAQDPGTILGKIIRMDPDGGTPEIVVTGVRNPWRYAFDTDGSLWIGDVGQGAWEEVDHLRADQIDGANLGWSGYEGTHPYLEGDGRRPDDAIAPVFEYSHDHGNCSITGGFPYHGQALAGLDGAYLFADYCAGNVRAITLGTDGKLAAEYDLGVHVDQPISFGRDAHGELYVLSEGGDIARLGPA